MTLREARDIISKRLVFGDPAHIEAVALVELAKKAAVVGFYRFSCVECSGTGRDDGDKCDECNGAGLLPVYLTGPDSLKLTAQHFRAALEYAADMKALQRFPNTTRSNGKEQKYRRQHVGLPNSQSHPKTANGRPKNKPSRE
jgi:hypothetical protein